MKKGCFIFIDNNTCENGTISDRYILSWKSINYGKLNDF